MASRGQYKGTVPPDNVLICKYLRSQKGLLLLSFSLDLVKILLNPLFFSKPITPNSYQNDQIQCVCVLRWINGKYLTDSVIKTLHL